MKTLNRKGFTLIEVVIVIAILAILGSLAMVSLSGWKEKRGLQGVANNITGELQLARMRAIREACPVVVLFTASLYTIFVDRNNNGIQDSDEEVLLEVNLPAGLALENSFADSKTKYDSRGLPSPTGTITCKGVSGKWVKVKLEALGRVQTTLSPNF